MTRSRLRDRYLKHPNVANRNAYKKHRNFCVRLFKKEKKNYYENLDINKFTEKKSFWKAIKHLFTKKQIFHNNITLVENNIILVENNIILVENNIILVGNNIVLGETISF